MNIIKEIFHKEVSGRQIAFVEAFLIILLTGYKLFASHIQYDINVFVEWEGAYRLYLGQVPFQDFGMPVGYVFWIIPALFFKIFGPYVFTLLLSQAFINLISGFTFWGILRLLGVNPSIRLAAVLVYCLSFTMDNLWPWYNHSVFVFELIGLYFVVKATLQGFQSKKSYFYVTLCSMFMVLAMLTKQDVGGLGLVFGFVIVLYGSWVHKTYFPVISYVLAYVLFLFILIGPFLQYEFTYWFNYGQEPHYSRVSSFDLIDEFLFNSPFIKLYLLLVVVILLNKSGPGNFNNLLHNKRDAVFLLLTVGILLQAAIVQVTSYTPSDGNIYFHSFALAYILASLRLNVKYQKVYVVIALFLMAGLWWSQKPWKIVRKRIASVASKGAASDVVSKNTFIIDTAKVKDVSWTPAKLKVFKRIKLPEPTNEGLARLMELPLVKNGKDLKVLNMSELTPLAYEIGYEPETGPDYPLWYHQGVAFFDREVETFCEKIEQGTYDLILFEDIPRLNQFYPYAVRDCIRENYKMEFKFYAPRSNPFLGWVEVYVKR